MLVVALVVAGVLVVAAGWRGIPRTTLRFCHARSPHGAEAQLVQEAATAFALAYGMRAPKIWVVDDPAMNALAFGRRTAGNICFTTGALSFRATSSHRWPVTTSRRSRVVRSRDATSAADLVLLGEWCTRILWVSAAFVILAVIVGLPIEIAVRMSSVSDSSSS